VETRVPGFRPREGNIAPDLEEWKDMTQEKFSSRFKGSPVKRTKLEGLMRNIGIVLESAKES
jgi:epoxyqueuosine reductase